MQIESLRQYWRFLCHKAGRCRKPAWEYWVGLRMEFDGVVGWGLGIIDRQTSILREALEKQESTRSHRRVDCEIVGGQGLREGSWNPKVLATDMTPVCQRQDKWPSCCWPRHRRSPTLVDGRAKVKNRTLLALFNGQVVSRQLQAVNWLTCGRSFLSLRLEMGTPGQAREARSQGWGSPAGASNQVDNFDARTISEFPLIPLGSGHGQRPSERLRQHQRIRNQQPPLRIADFQVANPTRALLLPPNALLARPRTRQPLTAPIPSDNRRRCSIEGLRALVHLITERCWLFLLLPPHSIDPLQLARRSRTTAPSLPAPR
jgi:hypothetical protein